MFRLNPSRGFSVKEKQTSTHTNFLVYNMVYGVGFVATFYISHHTSAWPRRHAPLRPEVAGGGRAGRGQHIPNYGNFVTLLPWPILTVAAIANDLRKSLILHFFLIFTVDRTSVVTGRIKVLCVKFWFQWALGTI